MPDKTKVHQDVLTANAAYAADFGDKKDLALPPARGFAILTCMDARLDPAKYAGLAEGDAHVIRNAGGRATDDAIRSLVISHKLLGTKEWFVIHHTNCGMELFSDEVIGDLLDDNLETAAFDGKAWSNPKHGHGRAHGHFIKWYTIDTTTSESVVQDVRRIREHPLVAPHHPDLRLCLRREDGAAARGQGSDRGGPPGLNHGAPGRRAVLGAGQTPRDFSLRCSADRSIPMNSAVREMLPPKRLICARRYSFSNSSRASRSGSAMMC